MMSRSHPLRKSAAYDQLQLDVTAKTYRYLDDEEQAAAQQLPANRPPLSGHDGSTQHL